MLHAKYGYDSVRYVPRDEVRSVLADASATSPALYDSNCGHLHPLNYTLGLAAAAETHGARIFEDTRALRHRSAATRVACARAARRSALQARRALRQCVSRRTAPPLASKIMAVGTYIVATEPLGEERAAALITNNAAVADMNWVLDYFRRSADHRLLFGGRVNYSGLSQFDAPDATRAAHGRRVSAARGREDRLRMGRRCGHHAEPRAAFRAARAERVLPAGLLGARHRAHGHRGQARGGGHRRHGGALRRVREHSAPELSRAARRCAGRRWCWRCCTTA